MRLWFTRLKHSLFRGSTERMELQDGRYYAFHFDDVSVAVNYCSSLVPFVVKRLRNGGLDGIESPAIWFHVAAQSPNSLGGCDLLVTRGAILAAVEGGLATPLAAPAPRVPLPPGAVLVLGEDSRQAPLRARGPRPKDTEALLDQIIQMSA